MLKGAASKVMWVGRATVFFGRLTRGMQPSRLLVAALAAVIAASVVVVARTESAEAAFPGTNGKIAFETDRESVGFERSSDIYVMNPDGTALKNLSDSTGDSAPAYSANGKKVVFTSLRDGSSREIYRMNATGTLQTRLTKNTANDHSPAWSPNGKKIAFSSNRDDEANEGPEMYNDQEIYTMRSDGTKLKQLTINAGAWDARSIDDIQPVYSPDGKKIAFASNRDGDHHSFEIYVMNADGTGQTRLTQNGANDSSPDWSANGKRIVFVSDRDGDDEIYAMKSDGTRLKQLTKNTDALDESPVYSPDNKKIAFASRRDGDWEVYTMDAVDADGDGNGDNQTNLTQNASDDTNPDWRPLP